MQTETRVVLAGGGTAGHIFPGLAVAEELLSRGVPQSDIHFATSKVGVGADAVQRAGFSHTTLSGRGIQRNLHPRAILANLAASTKLTWGTLQALKLLRRVRPNIVLCLGGYVSVSAGAAARVLRIPVVVAEQNAVPGWANKVVSRYAKAAAVSFEGTNLPRSRHTGNPVRKEILEAKAENSSTVNHSTVNHQAENGETTENASFKVLILGGSLGAGHINKAVREAFPYWRERDAISILHITGQRDWEEFEPLVGQAAREHVPYAALPFADNIAELLVKVDLVIGRSGAGIVAELAVMGKPSLLIPLPEAPGDHQTANAQALGDGAVVIPQAEFDGERLAKEIDRFASNPELVKTMADAAFAHARPLAAKAVADLLQEFARG